MPMKPPTQRRASELFAALSHPTRLRMAELLCRGERTVNDIAGDLGLSQSGTSQHLAILTRAGALVVEPHGTTRVYRVRGPRIARILTLIEEFCEVHDLADAAEEEGSGGGQEE